MINHALIKKAKSNVVNIAIMLIAVFIAFNIYMGKQKELKLLRDNSDSELKKNEVLQDIALLQKNILQIKEVVNNNAISTVISSLGIMAREAQVKIKVIKPLPESLTADGVCIKYPFELNITTNSYHKMGKFISIIEKSPDFYTIDELAIVCNSRVGEEKISVKIVLSTIRIKD